MASRKKSRGKEQVTREAARPATPAPPSGRRKAWTVGIIAGVLVGVIAGAIAHFSRGGRENLGTLNTPPTTAPAAGVPTPLPDEKLVFASYAGSESCRECHAQAYDLWAKSHHGLAERNVDPALDKPAFDPPREFAHGSQKSLVRTGGGRFEVVTHGEGKEPRAYPVERVIGVKPLRQYLTPGGGGRMQTLEASYDPHKNEWFNVYGGEDRRFGEWGHWTGRGMNWNSMCAACHNTRVRKNYDEKADAYRTSMAQATVSCESCHGPMKAHVDAKKSGAATSPAAAAAYKRFTKDQTLDTCGSCHARRAELTGDFAPGDAFHDHFSLAIPDLSDLFYPDGQVRDEDYELTAFLGSRMHAAGVRCGDCHEPHSSRPLFQGNNLCMRCHNGSFQGSPVIVPERHSFHKAESAGNQCVNCHMPQTTYMQRHGRHDHGFTVPDPLMTKEHGVPNACNRCHTDKDADWSLQAVDKWYGPKMQRPQRERARTIAKARAGDGSAWPALLNMLEGEKQPFWQAVAAGVLSPWAGRLDVRTGLLKALEHPSPLVRENAARALMPLAQQQEQKTVEAMRKLLNDPARSVRVRVGWALRDTLDLKSRSGGDLLASLAVNADQPTGAMEQATFHASRGDMATAATYAQKAVTWDPNSAALRDSYSNVLILLGHTAQAAEQLEWATKLAPREASYAYKLGLTYERLGRPEDAVAAIARAESANPADAEMPYARATILLRLNRRDEARQAAQRALQIDPNYRDAAELLQMMQR